MKTWLRSGAAASQIETRPGITSGQIEIANPAPPPATRHARPGGVPGSHMALANIRERLALYYDLEARLETSETATDSGAREYRVTIVLPCRSAVRA